MDFSQLDYFRIVARRSNLTRAAEELCISQPGLSRALSRLEEELGVPLFERRKGKITLNTYGQVFLANVEMAFEQLDQGVDSIRRMYSKEQNILSVACSIDDFLIDRLKEFSALYPEISIRQHTGSLAEIEAELLQHNIDLAICAHAPRNKTIQYEPLSYCPYVLVCRQDDPLAAKGSVRLARIKDRIFICDNSRLDRKQLSELCAIAGFQPRISHEIENGYILFNLLQDSNGVAVVPLAYYLKIDHYFPTHRLRALRLGDEDLPVSELGVAYHPKRIEAGGAKAFLEHLRRWASQENERMACFT